MLIYEINRKVEEVYRITKEREKKEHRPFGDILQEELKKMKKATKDTDQSNPR